MTQEKLEELTRKTRRKLIDFFGYEDGPDQEPIEEIEDYQIILEAIQTAVAEQQELDAKIAEGTLINLGMGKRLGESIAKAIKEGKKGLD